MKQQPFYLSFADLLLGQRKIKHAFFSQIDKIIDWIPFCGIIEAAYTKAATNPQVVGLRYPCVVQDRTSSQLGMG